MKLKNIFLIVVFTGLNVHIAAWGDYATEPDNEINITNNLDVAERNIARHEAEEKENERVRNWGKKSLKDKFSSISLFRNRNSYSDSAHDANTVSLGEALKFTFGKKDAADKSIVNARRVDAARDIFDRQLAREAERRARQNLEERQRKAENEAKIKARLKSIELDVLKAHREKINTALDSLKLQKPYAWYVPSKAEVDAAYQKELTHLNSLDLSVDVKQRFLEKLKNAKDYFDKTLPEDLNRAKARAMIWG